jgi:hypothetical protein
MIRICAWCNTVLGQNDVEPREGKTHTICQGCWDNLDFQQGVALPRYLDTLSVPILVIDDGGRVQTANDAAMRFLGKTLAEISGFKGGNVFECRYARLPEGCGNTVHCSACTVRRTVMDTFTTGEGHFRVPAMLNIGTMDDSHEVHFYITTRKEDNMVLLHVEMVVAEATKSAS